MVKRWQLVWGQKRRGQWQQQLRRQKQRTWQQWQRWREGEGNNKGKWNVDSNGDDNSHKDGILDGDCEGDSTWNGYGEGGGGGEGWQIIYFKLIMHLSTIILTSINIKQQLNSPNIKSVLSSIKVVSLMWWNKRSADISSRWPLQRRWAILCVTNIYLWWSITQSIWGRKERSNKRQTRHK